MLTKEDYKYKRRVLREAIKSSNDLAQLAKASAETYWLELIKLEDEYKSSSDSTVS